MHPGDRSKGTSKESETLILPGSLENIGCRRNTIMLPSEGFGEFVSALERLMEFESKI